MPELLFELGCEELPATSVQKAFTQLQNEILARLDNAGIGHGPAQCLGTPRRSIVIVQDVAERQPDATKEQRGPATKAAYALDGSPSPALLGFCRSQGVTPEDLRQEGDYVWATKTIAGRPTLEVLGELLPASVRAMTFDKSMRWGSARMRFVRPIRWMLASFGGAVVDFEIEGVRSGLQSRGHRFESPESFEAGSAAQLLSELRRRFVEPDPKERETRIREQAQSAASGSPDLTDALVDENVYLTEWPTAVEGSFKTEYLELPEAVLVTAMAKHERFFPVRDADGALMNRFISIRNAGVDDVVRAGNEWVLNARFNDAKFFFDEDRKCSLDDFLAKTARMTYQDKLGSVRQRSDRLAELSGAVAEWGGADPVPARKAGLYSKADLSCGLVSELPSLQGIIGAEYARRDGMDESIAWAIATQYDLPKNLTHGHPDAKIALSVLIADQIDKLAGYLGIGLVPSGSSDPFGLRRAVTLLIEAAWGWPGVLPGFLPLIESAQRLYAAQGFALDTEDTLRSVAELFESRYEAMMSDVRHDILTAATRADDLGEVMTPRNVRLRVNAQTLLADDVSFIQTCTRPLNIVSAAIKKGVEFGISDPFGTLDDGALDSKEGSALADQCNSLRETIDECVARDDADGLVAALRKLQAPINEFFESTMIMAEEPTVRYARLTLLQGVCTLLLSAGDFSKIIVAGD